MRVNADPTINNARREAIDPLDTERLGFDLEAPLYGGVAPWFGSKRTLAPLIVAEAGRHSAWWEPCCGSCAVTLSKPPCRMETVNDLHGHLVNLLRVMADRTLAPQLYRRLRRTPFGISIFQEARAAALGFEPPVGSRDLDAAEAYFICSWQGMNGVAGTASTNLGFCRRFTNNGGHAAKRWRGVVHSIPAFRRRLERVVVDQMDAVELVERAEDVEGSVFYVDPPYLVKGAKYRHDFDDADHRRLADALRAKRRSRVVVSYYAHPRLAELYPGWTVVPCPTTKSMVSSGKRQGKHQTIAPEVLLINGPSYTAGAMPGLFAADRGAA